MKIKFCIIGLILLFSIQLFSQENTNQKKVFTYKTIAGHEIKANIFLPEIEGPHPVVIYFHGGGFIFGNRDQGLNNILKDKLLAADYAVISADYRLAPETKLEEILIDVKDIIKWVRSNGRQKFNIDINKIVTIGGSAGGYLALSSGFYKDSAPNGIIAISTPTGFSTTNIQTGNPVLLNLPGPYSIVKNNTIVSYGDYDKRMSLWRFLAKNRLALYEVFGFDPAKEPGKLEQFTLTNNIKDEYPPTLIIHAKNDRLVDLQQAKVLHEFLKNHNLKSKLYVVENGHSSRLINQNPDAVDEIITFLDTLFKR